MSLLLALEHAKNNPVKGLPKMGAVLIYGKRAVAGHGWNSLKSDPMAAKFAKHPEAIYLHAELSAIKDALKVLQVSELKNCTLYIARVLKNGQPALAKPCEGCVRALVEFGINKVFWTE